MTPAIAAGGLRTVYELDCDLSVDLGNSRISIKSNPSVVKDDHVFRISVQGHADGTSSTNRCSLP